MESFYTPPFYGSYQSFYNHPSSSLITTNYTTSTRKIKARRSHPKIIQQINPRSDSYFSPQKRRKRARTLATFATRKLLTRGLAAPFLRLSSTATFGRWIRYAVRFAHPTRPLRGGRISFVGQPDAFGAGEFARHMRRRAKLGGKQPASARFAAHCVRGICADRRSSARAKRSGLKAPQKGLRNFALHYSTANCPQYTWNFLSLGLHPRLHAESRYKN